MNLMTSREHNAGIRPVSLPRLVRIAGWILLGTSAIFIGRILYEETFLTCRRGPQMVGFSIGHGAAGVWTPVYVVGALCTPLGFLWLVASVVYLAVKRKRPGRKEFALLGSESLLLALLVVPYTWYEGIDVMVCGPGDHAGEFLIDEAAAGNRFFVRYMLDKGYRISVGDTGGRTPLSAAAIAGNSAMVKYLLMQGADINQKDPMVHETALMSAIEMGNFGIAQLLLKNGADPCIQNYKGKNAAEVSVEFHHPEIADFISQRSHCGAPNGGSSIK